MAVPSGDCRGLSALTGRQESVVLACLPFKDNVDVDNITALRKHRQTHTHIHTCEHAIAYLHADTAI